MQSRLNISRKESSIPNLRQTILHRRSVEYGTFLPDVDMHDRSLKNPGSTMAMRTRKKNHVAGRGVIVGKKLGCVGNTHCALMTSLSSLRLASTPFRTRKREYTSNCGERASVVYSTAVFTHCVDLHVV